MTQPSNSLVWLGKPAETKRDAVLASAQLIFSEHGFRQTEVQEISNQTGISKATIYKLFGSKDNLLLEMVRELFNHLGMLALREVATTTPALERLMSIAEAFLQFGESNQELCLLVLRDGGHCMKEIGQDYQTKMAQFLPGIEPLFDAARKDGSLGKVPTENIVDAILSCLLGHFQSWLFLYNGQGSLVEKGMRDVKFLIKGFSAGDAH